LLLPLYVRERPIGVVGLGDPAGLTLGAEQVAFVDALTRYVALALERMRLAGEADAATALREADRLKDAFVATVSHDLRTPLTTIRALAAEMREADPDRAVVIEEEADRLNRLVADLLDLSRVRAGALPLDVQVTAAEDVVGAALQRLAGVAGGGRIVVKLPPGGALPLGRFDFVHTLRVLCNLLENALKHAPGTAPVELEVEVRCAWLRFRVLDRGPGVPESERSRIFDAFFSKAPGDARAQGAGTGLGLTIAKSLAEVQSGSLTYAPRDGGGSVFTLELPAEPTPDLA
jgi:two-component system sensor histidine kinase KdpD